MNNSITDQIFRGIFIALGVVLVANLMNDIYKMGFDNGKRTGLSLWARNKNNVITPIIFKKPANDEQPPAC
jgi:hypothetical protein